MQSIYKGYKTVTLGSLTKSLTRGERSVPFRDTKNSLYIETASANIRATTLVADISAAPSNFQLTLGDDIEPEYVALFLSSAFGRAIVKSYMPDQNSVRAASPVSLRQLPIPIPPKPDRRAMIENSSLLKRLQTELEQIHGELIFNPLSGALGQRLQQMLEVTALQTEADRILALIRQGESKTVEFKQTFQYCIRRKQKEDDIETSALKTLVGFLNRDGGTLLIGVEDTGEVLGIGTELSKFHKDSKDKFLLRIKDRIEKRIGIEALRDINERFVDVNDQILLRIECGKSAEPIFLDGTDYYVRNTPSTDKLVGKEMANDIKLRFGAS